MTPIYFRLPREIKSRIFSAVLVTTVGMLLYGCNLNDALSPDEPPAPAPGARTACEGSSVSFLSGTGDFETHAILMARPQPDCRFIGWNGLESETGLVALAEINGASDLQGIIESRFKPQFLPLDPAPFPFLGSPWPGDFETRIIQGNDSPFSHRDRFAWDVPLPIGTPILAPLDGIVVDVMTDLPNLPEESSSNTGDANFMVLEHMEGFQTLFLHLDQFSTHLKPGDPVWQGQVIARSGHNGVSSVPHLHFERMDETGAPLPAGLKASGRPSGVAMEGDTIQSQNFLSARENPSGFRTVISSPDSAIVDFGVEFTLDGLESVLPKGISTRWIQSAGPQAMILDRDSLLTTATILPGPGGNRVAFQLQVVDGTESIPPAEINLFLPDVRSIGSIRAFEESFEITHEDLVSPQEPISAALDQITAAVEFFNVQNGDFATLELRAPQGFVVRRSVVSRFVKSEPKRLMVTTFRELPAPLQIGRWSLHFMYNETIEKTVEFMVFAE